MIEHSRGAWREVGARRDEVSLARQQLDASGDTEIPQPFDCLSSAKHAVPLAEHHGERGR